MLLSQRIKEGVIKFPTRTTYEFFGANGDTACVLGCAYWSLFKDKWYESFPAHTLFAEQVHPALVKEYPHLSDVIKHPNRNGHSSLFTIITILNDKDGWTRMEIAKWLEGLGY